MGVQCVGLLRSCYGRRAAEDVHFWGVKRHDGHGSTVWSELDITN